MTRKRPTRPIVPLDDGLFYVRLGREGPDAPFHKVSYAQSLDALLDTIRPTKQRANANNEVKSASAATPFGDAISDFTESIVSFMLAANSLMSISDALPSAQMDRMLPAELERIAAHVKKRPTFTYFGIHREYLDVMSQFDLSFESSARFSEQFPGMLLSALIAQYDAFLSRIVEAICFVQPEVISSADKQITLAELSSFKTIEDARQYMIEKESERVLRDSHDAQMQWFEKKCGVRTKDHVESYTDFLEICERRNLIVHTDGRVSSTYLSNCARLKIDTKKLVVGDRLRVTPDYYRKAVSIVFELGFKLAMTCWERYAPQERAVAESRIVGATFDLIKLGKFKLAARTLKYFVDFKKEWNGERVRLMCLVNYANAVKLGGDKDQALAILGTQDWSASSRDFKICVAAVRDDAQECAIHMRALGQSNEMLPSAYRSWPVFKGVRDMPEFKAAYEEIYGDIAKLEKDSLLARH